MCVGRREGLVDRGSSGRASILMASIFWENLNLPGRTSGNWLNITVDLSGPQDQGLTNQTVESIWRTPGGAIDLDTIQVFGTVPEPSVVAFLAFGVLGLLRVRRRS